MTYYAISKGRKIGIVDNWKECTKSIYKYPGAAYKKFDSLNLAKQYLIDENKEPELTVYTDGACDNNGKIYAAASYGIWFGENDPRNISEKIVGKQSNNVSELFSIIKLYEIIEKEILENKIIHVYSDSNYSLLCLSSYGEKNEKINWSKHIPNKELVKKAYNLYKDKPNVKFIYIKAHTGKKDKHSIGNENADRLAKAALTKAASTCHRNVLSFFDNC